MGLLSFSGSQPSKSEIVIAKNYLDEKELLGIVRELTARKRNRLFRYAGYIEIMNRGTELPG